MSRRGKMVTSMQHFLLSKGYSFIVIRRFACSADHLRPSPQWNWCFVSFFKDMVSGKSAMFIDKKTQLLVRFLLPSGNETSSFTGRSQAINRLKARRALGAIVAAVDKGLVQTRMPGADSLEECGGELQFWPPRQLPIPEIEFARLTSEPWCIPIELDGFFEQCQVMMDLEALPESSALEKSLDGTR